MDNTHILARYGADWRDCERRRATVVKALDGLALAVAFRVLDNVRDSLIMPQGVNAEETEAAYKRTSERGLL